VTIEQRALCLDIWHFQIGNHLISDNGFHINNVLQTI